MRKLSIRWCFLNPQNRISPSRPAVTRIWFIPSTATPITQQWWAATNKLVHCHALGKIIFYWYNDARVPARSINSLISNQKINEKINQSMKYLHIIYDSNVTASTFKSKEILEESLPGSPMEPLCIPDWRLYLST